MYPEPEETSASVTVIAVDEDLPAGAEVADVVQRAPGTVVQRLGGLGDYAAVSIRGSSLRQVEVFVDGIPLNPDGSTAVDLSELPLRAFERVEVYRGAAPPELGASAMGGVVNLVTGRQQITRTATTLGSWSTTRHATTWSADEWLLAVDTLGTRGDFRTFDDGGTVVSLADDRLRRRSNNDKAQLAGHVRWRGGDRLRWSVLDSLLARDAGVPGRTFDALSEARYGVVQDLLVVQAETDAVLGRLWGRLRLERLDDPTGSLGSGAVASRDTTDSEGVRLTGRTALTSWLAGSLTGEVRRDGFLHRDGGRVDPGRRRNTAKGVLALALGPEDVRFTPVVHAVHLDNSGIGDVALLDEDAPPTPDLSRVLPRAGLLVRPTDWLRLRANAGTYLRAPDFTELFGNRGNLIGRPDLLPEQGWQVDAGAAVAADSVSAELGGFLTRATDRIVYVQTGQGTAVPVNLGDSRVTGIEGAVGFDVGPLRSGTNATLSDSAEISEDVAFDGNQLPRIPLVELHQNTAFVVRDARVGHSWALSARTFQDRANRLLLPPRSLHGAFVRYEPGPWSLEAEVRNLLDTIVVVTPRDPVRADAGDAVRSITDFVGYPLPGRTFLLTFSWQR